MSAVNIISDWKVITFFFFFFFTAQEMNLGIDVRETFRPWPNSQRSLALFTKTLCGLV